MKTYKTEHIRTVGEFYFLPLEKKVLLVYSVVSSIILLFATLFFMPKQILAPILIMFCMFSLPYFYFLYPAYKRAQFLKRGGYYQISDDSIKIIDNSKIEKTYLFEWKSLVEIKRSEDVSDIVLGGKLKDFIGSFDFTFNTKLEICGVKNSQEVLEFLALSSQND